MRLFRGLRNGALLSALLAVLAFTVIPASMSNTDGTSPVHNPGRTWDLGVDRK